MRHRHVVDIVARILKCVAPDSTLILYGSEARGDARPDSDIDVLVIIPDNYETFASRKLEITGSLYEVELSTGISISPLIVMKSMWTRMKTPFTCNVAREGIIL